MLLLVAGCAAGGEGTPVHESMPAARAALRPELRIFYDALQGYGDWILIEPYGYVFRPSINVAEWQPYSYGFWVPSDIYGWTWISSEPFGWATYHYGRWINDPYQGWVWAPGNEWGPAWVGWQQSDSYVGWSPLAPGGAPGSGYQWVPTATLGSTDLHAHVATTAQLGARLGPARTVQNLDRDRGVTFDRGPRIEDIERITGPLGRVHIEDSLPSGGATTPAPRPAANAGGYRPAPLADAARRAAEQSAREADALSREKATAPGVWKLVRPIGVPGRARGAQPASSDSTP